MTIFRCDSALALALFFFVAACDNGAGLGHLGSGAIAEIIRESLLETDLAAKLEEHVRRKGLSDAELRTELKRAGFQPHNDQGECETMALNVPNAIGGTTEVTATVCGSESAVDFEVSNFGAMEK